MSLTQAVEKAKAQLAEATQELCTITDPKRRREAVRDIADARYMIQRAEHWLTTTSTEAAPNGNPQKTSSR